MSIEDSAFCGQGLPFCSTMVIDHPRLGRVRMNSADYDAATCGPVIDGPTMPPVSMGEANPPNKNPFIDADGNRIADAGSPMHRA
jgi:hypothetical protein